MSDQLWLFDGKGALLTGTPEDLVLQGHISRLYSQPGEWGFDIATGEIVAPAPFPPKKRIRLSGEGPEHLWTKKALIRTGHTVVDSDGTDCVVDVGKNGQSVRWIIIENGNTQIAGNIGEMLACLENAG